MRMISATFATVFAFALSFGGAHAQSEKPGVEKLYILSCGEGAPETFPCSRQGSTKESR
jgi:N-acyl homoserine lactone hydrolase